MSTPDTQIPREEMADRFIALANEFSKTQSQERIGAALMFAAVHFNAYEASTKSTNLVNDKPDTMEWYGKEYRRMFEANYDEMRG